jgi:uncharacterized protein with PIN domain
MEDASLMAGRPKLICDHMLGTLARWLRILGFDTAYPKPLEDEDLVGLARREDRIILTRDKDLASRKGVRALYISSDVLEEQVEQVLKELRLTIRDPMSRCPLCNTLLEEVERGDVAGKVPEGVYEQQQEFWRCPTCDKYYWQGSHWDRMSRQIEGYEALTRKGGED